MIASDTPGDRLTTDPDLHLLANGLRIDAHIVTGQTYTFRIPAGTRNLTLKSRSSKPSDLGLSADTRDLGFCVILLTADSEDNTYNITIRPHHASLSQGFYPAEGKTQRWSNGNGVLTNLLLGSGQEGILLTIQGRALPRYALTDPVSINDPAQTNPSIHSENESQSSERAPVAKIDKQSFQLLSKDLTSALAKNNWSVAELISDQLFQKFEEKIEWWQFRQSCYAKCQVGKPEDAQQLAFQAAKKFPNTSIGLVCLADNARFKADWKLASTIYAELIHTYQSDPEIINWRALLCDAMFNNNSLDVSTHANDLLKEILKTKNQNPSIYTGNAIKLAKIKQFDVANNLCATARELFPENADVWRTQAWVSELQGFSLAAVKAWKRAASLSQNESLTDCLFNEIRVLIQAGRYSELTAKIEFLKKELPNHPKTISTELTMLEASGDFLGAIKCLESVTLSEEIVHSFSEKRMVRLLYDGGYSFEETNTFFKQIKNLKITTSDIETVYCDTNNKQEDITFSLKNKYELHFNNEKNRNTVLRHTKNIFLKNRTYINFLWLVQYWSTFADKETLTKLYQISLRLFSHSRIRALLGRFLGYSQHQSVLPSWSIDLWKKNLPQNQCSLRTQFEQLSYSKLTCICVVRDEAEMLPKFLTHYRALGVQSFVIINNDLSSNAPISKDLIVEYDLQVIDAPFSFMKNGHGMTWINEFLEMEKCEWLLFVDADEFLIYPHHQHLNILEYVNHLESQGQNAVSAFMLDMYDEGYRDSGTISSELNDHNLFAANHIFCPSLYPPHRFITGGVRGSERWSNILSKTPLINAKAGIRYTNNHFVTESNQGENTAVLLHYKIFRDRSLIGLTEAEVIQHPRVNDRTGICIARHLQFSQHSANNVIKSKSVRFKNTEQMTAFGYMQSDLLLNGRFKSDIKYRLSDNRLSIVIPSRTSKDQLEYLEKAVMSIRSQSVIDDFLLTIFVITDKGCSLDATFVNRHGITLLESAGFSQAAALNRGLKEINQGYIAFLEDDDQWMPEYLSSMFRNIQGYDFISSSQLNIQPDGTIVKRNYYPTPSGWLMPFSTLDKIGLFNESYKYHIDNEWIGRLTESGLTRVHLIERLEPLAEKFDDYFRLNQTLLDMTAFTGGTIKIVAHDFSHPLIKKLWHDTSGMGQIRTKKLAKDISEVERKDLIERFGSIPH